MIAYLNDPADDTDGLDPRHMLVEELRVQHDRLHYSDDRELPFIRARIQDLQDQIALSRIEDLRGRTVR